MTKISSSSLFCSCDTVFGKQSVNRPPTPEEDVADDFERDELTIRESINIKFVESGEKENLMELVRDRLVECGWKDEMKIACREHVKKKGRKDVTVDELIRVITPKGRASVPDSVKAELLNRIQNFIVSTAL
ncbi:Transcription and mRNA export factor ENY2 [Cardamine amara subsp. amara]|uniref:Transcription and mRNA export factor ENY2 n=1 Tax=Cardamine amara subsp. amara TaxID=228776 RepID=A0ABD1ATP1_CARAN